MEHRQRAELKNLTLSGRDCAVLNDSRRAIANNRRNGPDAATGIVQFRAGFMTDEEFQAASSVHSVHRLQTLSCKDRSMPKIRSGLIEDMNGRYVILEEDGLFWAAEIRDIAAIPTSEHCADVATRLAQFQQSSGSGRPD
jgi:hypothetical protein